MGRIFDVQFGSKIEIRIKKIQTELFIIWYCKKVEFENTYQSGLLGHDSS